MINKVWISLCSFVSSPMLVKKNIRRKVKCTKKIEDMVDYPIPFIKRIRALSARAENTVSQNLIRRTPTFRQYYLGPIKSGLLLENSLWGKPNN